MEPRRLSPGDPDEYVAVLELIKREFSYMDGTIDPPSSIHRLTAEDLADGTGETWVIGSPPVACVLMTPRPDALYLSKLAVASSDRGRGLARRLIDQARSRAHELDVPWIELQTRIELTHNHRTFTALGFVETERTAHPGFTRPTSITFRRAVAAS